MKLEFKDIINKESDKNAIVIGMGPSLGKHINKINQLKNNGFVLISCNDVDAFTSIDPDYWVLANSEATIRAMHLRLNTKKAVVVYADSVDLTPRDEVDQCLKVDYLPYDQRHFNGHKCGAGACCKHIIPGRLTIQEELKKYTNHSTMPVHSGTVAVQMLPLAVLLGCKNIYVVGVDLDYSKGYVNGHNSAQARALHTQPESFAPHISSILETIAIIRDAANNIGVNIYCLDENLYISKVLKHASLP